MPRGIDREVVEIMHRTHTGVDMEAQNILNQAMRASIADGWGGSMLATDISDILFGTPAPLQSAANLGVLKDDEVNIIVHGHEPTLSEMIVVAAQDPEMIEYAKSKGANGINLAGICCTSNEVLMRHGIPPAGNYLEPGDGNRHRRGRGDGGGRAVHYAGAGRAGRRTITPT